MKEIAHRQLYEAIPVSARDRIRWGAFDRMLNAKHGPAAIEAAKQKRLRKQAKRLENRQ